MKEGKDYIGVGVGAVIVNDNGTFFLAKRGGEARNEAGKWEFPGGGMDFGDSFTETLKREMKEEHGVDVEIIDLLEFTSHFIPEDKEHWVGPTYRCRIISGEPQICEPHKCDQIGWFTLDEIKKLDLSVVTKMNLKRLIENDSL